MPPMSTDHAARRQEILKKAKTIVVKVGTNVLSTEDDRLDAVRIESLSQQLLSICKSGRKVVLVSSGAGSAAGMGLLGPQAAAEGFALICKPPPRPLEQAQNLIHLYDECMKPHGYHAAQLLLTANDCSQKPRGYLNVRQYAADTVRIQERFRSSTKTTLSASMRSNWATTTGSPRWSRISSRRTCL